MKKILIFILAVACYFTVNAQTTNDILELLIKNNTITQEQADSVRADAAIKEQEASAKKKSFNLTAGKALQLSGYMQSRYLMLEEKGKNDGFDIRRAYIDLKGNLSPYFAYRLQTDFATSPKIVDAQIDLKIYEYLNFTLGQQALPFSLNNVTSNTKLELPDRVQAVEYFSSRKGDVLGDNNGRDIGITLYGNILKIKDLSLIDYRFGIFNGSGINKTDLNEAKDFVGRLIFHPLKGLDLGGSYYYGWAPDSATLNNGVKDDKDRIAANQLGLRQRIGFEAKYEYSIFNLKGEYLLAKDGEIAKSGWYAQGTVNVLSNKVQVVGRVDMYDKNTNKADDGVTNITGGVNLIFGPNALLQIAYTNRDEESADKVNNIGTIQLQLSF
jgi:phosphate-selective porin OprO and OprP